MILPELTLLEDYEPTPPRVKQIEMDAKGAIVMKFSEPVFPIEDIKNKTITLDMNNLDGDRQGEPNLVEVPYIEVNMREGAQSNRTLLGFDYEIIMVGQKKILMDFKFENPEQVSFNQPEDQIEISFWGPFFDVKDGLQMSP